MATQNSKKAKYILKKVGYSFIPAIAYAAAWLGLSLGGVSVWSFVQIALMTIGMSAGVVSIGLAIGIVALPLLLMLVLTPIIAAIYFDKHYANQQNQAGCDEKLGSSAITLDRIDADSEQEPEKVVDLDYDADKGFPKNPEKVVIEKAADVTPLLDADGSELDKAAAPGM